MNWNETVAKDVRYGDILGKIIGDWEIIWEDSEADYQGHVSIFAKKKSTRYIYDKSAYEFDYFYYEYSHGSCSGCDTWEHDDFSDLDIMKEMIDTAIIMKGMGELLRWYEMLLDNGCDEEGKMEAIRKEVES